MNVVRTGDELLNTFPAFEEKYLIGQLIENNSLNLMVAPSYTGKTYVALHICKCITDNESFFSRDVDKGSVLYIDNEMKPKYFAKRLRKLGFNNPKSFIYANNYKIDLNDLSQKKHFLDDIRLRVKHLDLKLIVIDSLNAFSDGYEENSNSSMREVMSFLVEVSAICTTLIIHHVGKGNNSSNLTRDDIRGASCIVDKSDNVFLINALGESERSLVIDKARNHDIKSKPIFFSFEESDGILQFSRSFEKAPKKPLKEQVLDHFVPGLNRTQLMAHFRNEGMVFNDVEFDRTLEGMIQIDIIRGAKNAKFYYWNPKVLLNEE